MPESKEFKKLKASMFKEYLGKKVPKQYQNKYGKRYDKKDVTSFTFAVAKSRGIPERKLKWFILS